MRFVAITYRLGAKLVVTFGGQHAQRADEVVDVDEFIAVKSHRAKGKRITTYEVASLQFIEPEEPEPTDEDFAEDEPLDGEEMVDMDAEAIDMDDIVGEDIKADPNVDYDKRAEVDDANFSPAQLNLF